MVASAAATPGQSSLSPLEPLAEEGCRGQCGRLFRGLDGRALEWVQCVSRPVHYGAEEIIFQTGEVVFGCYIICRGQVKLVQPASSGKRHILKLLGQGDLLGEEMMFNQEVYTAYAKTLEPTTLHFLARGELVAFLRETPQVALRVIQRLAHELQACHTRLVETAYGGSCERLAWLLLALAERYGVPGRRGVDVGCKLSRTELAELAGLSTETVIRTLQKFKERGWVLLDGKKIFLRNGTALGRFVGTSRPGP